MRTTNTDEIKHLSGNPSSLPVLDLPHSNMPLCDYCKVIELNDEHGYQAVSENGSPCLEFEPSETVEGSRNRLLPLFCTRTDRAPGLALLKRTADDGCEFCRLLRGEMLELMAAELLDYRGEVGIELFYSWESPGFPGTGLSSLIAVLHWLDMPSPARARRQASLVFAAESDVGT